LLLRSTEIRPHRPNDLSPVAPMIPGGRTASRPTLGAREKTLKPPLSHPKSPVTRGVTGARTSRGESRLRCAGPARRVAPPHGGRRNSPRTSNRKRPPAELKHMTKRRGRNEPRTGRLESRGASTSGVAPQRNESRPGVESRRDASPQRHRESKTGK